MRYDFTLTAVIPAPPQEIYDAWVDSLGHTEMTGGPATMSGEIGADVSAWNNYITGRNLELVPGKRIVQSWRTAEFFDEDEDSIITVTLKDARGGTLLTLEHTNVPLGLTIYEQGGWETRYFEPMKKYFGKHRLPVRGKKTKAAVASVASRVRSLGAKAIYFGRFHPALNLLRARPQQRRFITCFGKNDGAGAQALAIMSTILFAHDAGLTYVHTPFRRIEHANGDPGWETKWEKFFNFGKDEIPRAQRIEPWTDCVALPRLTDLSRSGDNVLYVARHCHDYANYFPYRYRAVSGRLAEKYYSSDKKSGLLCHYDATRLNIAVHVRRGDVVKQEQWAGRQSPNEFVASVLRQIIDVAVSTPLPIAVRLYSQGEGADFGQLGDMDVEFHLNECPFSTLNNLVSADILLMSKSTFSYVAALLSRGVKVFEPFVSNPFDRTSFIHNPLPDWIVARGDGTLNKTLLRNALDDVIDQRFSNTVSSLKAEHLEFQRGIGA